MYVLVRCSVDFLNHPPQPVLVNPLPPFPYHLARSQLGCVEFACEVPEDFNCIEHFVNPVSITTITAEMYNALVARYIGWGLKTPEGNRSILIHNSDFIFLVASEDCRPIAVEVSTPQFVRLPFYHFEGVSLVSAISTTLDAVVHYWPDSFCHHRP